MCVNGLNLAPLIKHVLIGAVKLAHFIKVKMYWQ
jgi:hypothetical protein